jgi:hypothetical protein
VVNENSDINTIESQENLKNDHSKLFSKIVKNPDSNSTEPDLGYDKQKRRDL